jgi:pyranose oxidase
MVGTTGSLRTDVLIAGSGPIGCTFARFLAMQGRKVTMVDAGAQHSARPGEHLKNAFVYQRNLDKFTPIVQGLLHPVSIPVQTGYTDTLDPIVFRPGAGTIRSAQNPRQDPRKNLRNAAVSYGVGGMFTHWTNNTPRPHPTMERIPFIGNEEWEILYGDAEKLLNTHTDVYARSIRHRIVMDALKDHYGVTIPSEWPIQSLPVAGERRKDNDEFVHFTGADTILGPLIDEPETYGPDRFKILPQHRLTRLIEKSGRIISAEVEDLLHWEKIEVFADLFVVATGSILTPQVLWKSRIRPRALGRYLTEHPMTFCQIVMKDSLIKDLVTDSRFTRELKSFEPNDPVPIPMHDPPPMVWIPVSEKRPWHCQVHRDSFQYGALPPDIDDRLVVDLRWFGMTDPVETNRVYFEDDLNDVFGMPKTTFEFWLSEDDRRRAHEMMTDMVSAASALGGYLTGAEPRFMPPGSSLHFMGTYRMGERDEGISVTDPHSKVWGFENLYLGGNGLISTGTACNPTLTSIALALFALNSILNVDPKTANKNSETPIQ